MNTNKTLLRSIVTGSLIFYALSGLTSLLNYVFYPAIARVVTTDVYGEIQFLTSLFMQLAVGFIVLNILSIIITAKHTIDHERQQALQGLNAVATTAILAIIGAGSLLLGLGKESFGFTSIIPVAFLAFSLLLNVPFTIAIGKLQGEGRFVRSGVVATLGALGKLAFALMFVLIGWGTAGAMAGIAAGMLVAILAAYMMEGSRLTSGLQGLKRLRFRSAIRLYATRLNHFRAERSLLYAALLAMGILTILSTADVLAAKIFLSPHDAGQYAGVATVAKIILYATTPLMWLALPPALANLPETRLKTRRFVLLTGVVGVVLLALFSAAQPVIVKSLLSIDAGYYNSLLPLASVAMVLFSIAIILVAIDICRDRLRVTTTASLGALATFFIGFGLCNSMGAVKAAIIGQIGAACVAILISLIGNKGYERKI